MAESHLNEESCILVPFLRENYHQSFIVSVKTEPSISIKHENNFDISIGTSLSPDRKGELILQDDSSHSINMCNSPLLSPTLTSRFKSDCEKSRLTIREWSSDLSVMAEDGGGKLQHSEGNSLCNSEKDKFFDQKGNFYFGDDCEPLRKPGSYSDIAPFGSVTWAMPLLKLWPNHSQSKPRDNPQPSLSTNFSNGTGSSGSISIPSKAIVGGSVSLLVKEMVNFGPEVIAPDRLFHDETAVRLEQPTITAPGKRTPLMREPEKESGADDLSTRRDDAIDGAGHLGHFLAGFDSTNADSEGEELSSPRDGVPSSAANRSIPMPLSLSLSGPESEDDEAVTGASDTEGHATSQPGEKSFRCKVCGMHFRRNDHFVFHMRKHSGEKPFKCSDCDMGFTRKDIMIKHQRIHTGVKSFKCTHCGKDFSRKESLKVHVRKHSGETPFKCPDCNMGFTRKEALAAHVSKHTKDKPFKCHLCNLSFSHSNTLTNHIRKHTGEKPFKCPECGTAFVRRDLMVVHRRKHTNEKPYKCPECDMCFSLSSVLANHRRTHSGEKPFRCCDCAKSFATQATLIQHTRTHTGEKPFPCSECDKTFSRKSTLNYHIRTHTGEKPHKCSDCDMSFVKRNALVVHQATHSNEEPYNCPDCNKSFSAKNSLSYHRAIHSGEKPFSCPECDMCFAVKGTFKKHLKRHKGKRPFKCPLCTYWCESQNLLNIHKITHSG